MGYLRIKKAVSRSFGAHYLLQSVDIHAISLNDSQVWGQQLVAL